MCLRGYDGRGWEGWFSGVFKGKQTKKGGVVMLNRWLNWVVLGGVGAMLGMWGCAGEQGYVGAGESVAERSGGAETGRAIAGTVNGEPIYRDELVAVLLKGRGATVLEELTLLEVVRQEAARRGIEADDEMVKAELDFILEDMAAGKSRREKQGLLEYMLRSRGITRAEFDVIVERQGLLRRLVDKKVAVSESMIAEEYQRQHGAKVTVRQIVVGDPRTIETAERKLAEGADFVELVREVSQDADSLGLDGLLGPFSQVDEQVPEAVRAAALALREPGELSDIIRYRQAGVTGDRWALIRLEEVYPADGTPMAAVRGGLIDGLKRREIARRMYRLQQALREQATVRVLDSMLRRQKEVN